MCAGPELPGGGRSSWKRPVSSGKTFLQLKPPEPQDRRWSRLALRLAARGLGRTAPNPPVGCVLVRGGAVVGAGFHARAGGAHAEAWALAAAGERAAGATAYVTLEPCAHLGRTPPCADALTRAGVKRVVMATLDPDPRVSGRGLERLRAAGVEVVCGVLEAEAVRQQAGFRSFALRGRPWVVYKAALTLDGKVAAAGGEPGWVSGEAARARVHRWRDRFDAVAVGSGTALADDPHLGTRGVRGGRDARAVVFDRRGRLPLTAQVVRPGSVLVTTPETAADAYAAHGMTVVRAEGLSEALRALGQLGLGTLLLEGGPTLAGAFSEADLIDEVRFFVAPKLLGAGLTPLAAPVRPLAEALTLRDVRTERVGDDVLVQGLVHDVPRLRAHGEV